MKRKPHPCYHCVQCLTVLIENTAGIPKGIGYVCYVSDTIVKCPTRRCTEFNKVSHRDEPYIMDVGEGQESVNALFERKGKWGLLNTHTPPSFGFILMKLKKFRWEAHMPTRRKRGFGKQPRRPR